jgi:hypothetical protein
LVNQRPACHHPTLSACSADSCKLIADSF